MTKQKRLPTNYPLDKKTANRITGQIEKLIDDFTPKSVLGMLALAVEQDNSIVFYNRWALRPIEKQNYEIYDLLAKTTVYKNIALFSSALNIIFNLNRPIRSSSSKDTIIYNLDQEYYRCVEDIRILNKKLSLKTSNVELNSVKLIDKQHRLAEIKTRLSKIY